MYVAIKKFKESDDNEYVSDENPQRERNSFEFTLAI